MDVTSIVYTSAMRTPARYTSRQRNSCTKILGSADSRNLESWKVVEVPGLIEHESYRKPWPSMNLKPGWLTEL